MTTKMHELGHVKAKGAGTLPKRALRKGVTCGGTMLAAAFLLAILNCTAQLPACAQNFDVKTSILKNGMKVLVQEDHSLPLASLFIFYKIGSRNEHTGTTGVSHFFEHMMFKGAKKYGAGEFDRVMEAAGGENNAHTGKDLTVYYETFPPAILELIFDLEADRLANLSFEPGAIASERGVVASERRTSRENNNYGLLSEQLEAAAFTAHPYQWPVIGWMSDIENWKMEDLQNHFKMGYSPSNAVLVVLGDVAADTVLKLARKYIEPIPSHAPPPAVTTREPQQSGERRVVVKKFAQLPIFMVAYHIPESKHPDHYPLKLLNAILFQGESSRMYTRLVDKDQLALSVFGHVGFSLDPSYLSITVRPKEGVEPAAAEKALYEEIERVKTGTLTDTELQKAKNMMLAEFFQEMKTQDGRAEALGDHELYQGGYQKLFETASIYEKVTKEDLQRVAATYLTENNRTVATLIPDKTEKKAAAGKGGDDHE
jgi:zinc protease